MLNWQIIEVKIKKKKITRLVTRIQIEYPTLSKDQIQLIMEKKKIPRQP